MLRFPSYRSVLVCVRKPDGDEAWLAGAATGLVDMLNPSLGGRAVASTRWLEEVGLGTIVVHDGTTEAPDPLPATFVWGRPIGRAGDLTDDDLRRAEADPTSLREARGRFVVCAGGPGHLRLLTSSDTVHTLRAAAGPTAQVWGTHSVPTAWLTGSPVEVEAERIGELLVFDHVLGSADLLRGVRVLPDAAEVVIDRAGADERSWWPVSERVRPGPPASASTLRTAVVDALAVWTATPRVAFGLTAGRDSTLVASCLEEAGTGLRTFTLGAPDSPDVRRAAHTAELVGLVHDQVGVGAPVDRSLVVARAVFTGGAETARNLHSGAFRWGARDVLWLTGHGGEIGRAFHWPGHADATRARDRLLDDLRRALPAPHGEAAEDALRGALRSAEEGGRTGTGALDVFYLRNRMHRWLGNGVPHPQLGDLGCVYLAPDVARVLLDLPEADRSTGAAFDEALALGPTGLRPPPAGRGGRGRRLAARVVRRRRGRSAMGAAAVEHLVSLFPDAPYLRSALGSTWWDDQVARARRDDDPSATRHVFNALSVEALVAGLDALGEPPR